MTARIIMAAVLLVILAGYAALDSLNPWVTKEPSPAPSVVAATEKIGPDVIAVPVEPVEKEDMLQMR